MADGEVEDIIFVDQDGVQLTGIASLLLTWKDDQLCVDVACCHKETRRLAAGHFLDSVQFANLETALVQLEARECLVPAGLFQSVAANKASGACPTISEHLQLIFDRADILVTEVKRSDFSAVDVEQDLAYLTASVNSSNQGDTTAPCVSSGIQSSQAMSCLGAIIKFLNLKAEESSAKSFTLDTFSLDNYVRLDSAATRALHLLPGVDDRESPELGKVLLCLCAVTPPRDEDTIVGARYQSVYGVLNNCRTQQGQRLLAQWLRQPLTDMTKIDERLDLVEMLVCESGIRQTLHDDFLRRMPDLQRLAKRLQRRKTAGLQEIFRVYQTVERLPQTVDTLSQYAGPLAAVVRTYLIEPLQSSVNDFVKFQEMVESTLDLQAIQTKNEFNILADFDETLGELRTRVNELEEAIEDEFHRAARKLGLEAGKSVKLETNEQYGFFMRVTLKEEKTLREFKSFQVLDTQKAGVRFRNAAMSNLNDTHLDVKREYTEAQQGIVDEVMVIAAGYQQPLLELNMTVALLDVIVSLAVAAVSSAGPGYVRPKMLPRSAGRILLKDARHPCLEMQDAMSVIASDVHLERGKHNFQIITGPNMGGKSTYIRGVGVIVAMAQIGSFVPCSSAELVPVDAIMARVGASDCQLRGVSTFLAEMLETSAVLRRHIEELPFDISSAHLSCLLIRQADQAHMTALPCSETAHHPVQSVTANSLVIIDELGRGTSTYDGFGLAWAVASRLAGPSIGCFSLFATHFHELTSLASQMPGRVSNLRVAAQVSSAHCSDDAEPRVVMLYKVEPGVCQRSYGMDVARLAGLPTNLIRRAESMAATDEGLELLWLSLDNRCEGRLFDEGSSPSAKRVRSATEPMGAVETADQVRKKLLPMLDEMLASPATDFGSRVAERARLLLAEQEISPVADLLMQLSN